MFSLLHKHKHKEKTDEMEKDGSPPTFRGDPELMFQVQIMSDLHLEFPGNLDRLPEFRPMAPYLVHFPMLPGNSILSQ